MCMEPPLPLQTPVSFARISAIMRSMSMPLAMAWLWPLWVPNT